MGYLEHWSFNFHPTMMVVSFVSFTRKRSNARKSIVQNSSDRMKIGSSGRKMGSSGRKIGSSGRKNAGSGRRSIVGNRMQSMKSN